MARTWKIYIPVRPKPVQSVRGGSRGFFADHKVKKWKQSIIPYIQASCHEPPSAMPMRITAMRFIYRWPQKTPRHVQEYIRNGGTVPCIGQADLSDNLAKGLIDACAGLVFVNDKQVWQQTGRREKVYGEHDGIYLEFEETPSVLMIDGKLASGVKPGMDGLL